MQLAHERIVAEIPARKESRIRQWLKGKKGRLLAFGLFGAFGAAALSSQSGVGEGCRVQNRIDEWNRVLNKDACAKDYPKVLGEIQDEYMRLMKEGKKEEARLVVSFSDSVVISMNYRRAFPECRDNAGPAKKAGQR